MQVGLALILFPLVFFVTLFVCGVMVHFARQAGRGRERLEARAVALEAGDDEMRRRMGRLRARVNQAETEVRRIESTGLRYDRSVSDLRQRLIRKRHTLERTNRRTLVPAARFTSMLSGTAGQRRPDSHLR